VTLFGVFSDKVDSGVVTVPANADADDVEPNKTLLLNPNFSSDEDDGSLVTITPPPVVDKEDEVLKEVLLVVVGVLVIIVDVAIVDDGVPICSIPINVIFKTQICLTISITRKAHRNI
jgi:hypothetical protein